MRVAVNDHLDALLERAGIEPGVDDLGNIVFGGFLGCPDRAGLFEEVIAAGLEIRRHEGLPMAVQIPTGVGFFLVAWGCEWLHDTRVIDGDARLAELRKTMDRIERRHKVDHLDFPWVKKQAPEEWLVAERTWNRIYEELLVQTIRGHASDMADLYEADLAEFDRRREQGRIAFAELVGREVALREKHSDR